MKKGRYYHALRQGRNLLLLIICVFIGLSGCQKKEDAENLHILSEKNTGNVTEGIRKTKLKEELEVPDKLEKTVQSKNKKNTLTIQADIIVPDKTSIPERTIMPQSHTQEEADEMIKNIFPDGKLYEYEYYETEKEQKEKGFENEVSTLFEKNRTDLYPYTKDGEEKEGHITHEINGQNIAYNGKIYCFFLSDYDRLTREDFKNYEMIYGQSLSLYREEFNQDIHYSEISFNQEEVEKDQYPMPDISQEEALETAKEGMEKCHLSTDDYGLFSTEYITREYGKDGKKQTAYQFVFAKKADGVSIFSLPESGMQFPNDEKIGMLYWGPERLVVSVDEDGMIALDSGSDGAYGEGEGSSRLLPFDEIEKIMEAAFLKEEKGELNRQINHIELGYVRVWKPEEIKEAKLEAALKPAWVFHGKCFGKLTENGNERIGQFGDKNMQLAIDAATGEVLGKQELSDLEKDKKINGGIAGEHSADVSLEID